MAAWLAGPCVRRGVDGLGWPGPGPGGYLKAETLAARFPCEPPDILWPALVLLVLVEEDAASLPGDLRELDRLCAPGCVKGIATCLSTP